MANIDQFILGTDLYDLDGLTRDLLGKILAEHAGEDNAVRQRELCHYYFDPYPIRYQDEALISDILQRARGVMQDAGWFLDYRRRSGWFAVRTTEEAFDHTLRYAKREVHLHHRLQRKAHIAVGDRYQLPANNPLIQAIHGATPSIEQLEEAVNNPEPPAPPQLEEGHENENEDKS